MKLLDKSLNQIEFDNCRRMLEGEINRIIISNNVEEIIALIGFACDNIHMLAYSRIKQINKEGE